MSVRNDHELPRSRADVSDDASHQGPFEGQEAPESIVASLPEMAEYVSSIPDGQKATALDALERHYLQTALGLGYSEEPARSWVAALMAHLREQLELMSAPGPGDGRPHARGRFLLPRLRRATSLPSKIMSWILRRSRNVTSPPGWSLWDRRWGDLAEGVR
jgi:hypothetical protein